MLRCGPSKRPLVHGAAFLSTETLVCGQSGLSLRHARTSVGELIEREERTPDTAYSTQTENRKAA